jgi:indolepyruvate ferredoxin oxidoreductase alpha subunit
MKKNNTNIPAAQSALKDGLSDAHCGYITNVPGAKSQDLFTLLGGTQISINERIAFENCYGSSLAGVRSVLTMKNVGLNACLDPFVHAVLNGVHAGIVIVLYDDVEVTSSPERQDSRPLNDLFPGIWLEPNSIEDAYKMASLAPSLSEEADMPIVIRITNQLLRQEGSYTRIKQSKPKITIADKRSQFISYWTKRTKIYIDKLNIALKIVHKLFTSEIQHEHDLGIIMAGSCWEELEEKNLSNYDLLEIKAYPVDEKAILEFVKSHKNITIFEQGLPYLRNKVYEITGKDTLSIESYTGNTPDLSELWQTFNSTEKMFLGLKSVNPSYVVGDEGQFTDESTKTIQSCLCMGASIGITTGLALNNANYPFAITGDTSFAHGGIQSLQEAVAFDAKFGVVVLDNGAANSTGGQPRKVSIEDIPTGIKKYYLDYKSTSIEEFTKLFTTLQKENALAVVYIQL